MIRQAHPGVGLPLGRNGAPATPCYTLLVAPFTLYPLRVAGSLLKILFIGDIVGSPGRRAVCGLLPGMRQRHQADMVIANGENAAHGRGITARNMHELLGAGVDVVTSGNHIWDQKEIISYMDAQVPLLRPVNYPNGVPGQGYLVQDGVLVVNLMGRTFMLDVDCPFRTMDRLLAELPSVPKIVFVDFHADATSEKVAMGWYLDGRVSAVVGSHTHVPTADARVLPKGTAFISDAGMSGPVISIIGNEIQAVLNRYLTQMPGPLPVAEGPATIGAVLVEIDDASGRALSIRRVDEFEGEL